LRPCDSKCSSLYVLVGKIHPATQAVSSEESGSGSSSSDSESDEGAAAPRPGRFSYILGGGGVHRAKPGRPGF
jgi:hypothetical protein